MPICKASQVLLTALPQLLLLLMAAAAAAVLLAPLGALAALAGREGATEGQTCWLLPSSALQPLLLAAAAADAGRLLLALPTPRPGEGADDAVL